MAQTIDSELTLLALLALLAPLAPRNAQDFSIYVLINAVITNLA